MSGKETELLELLRLLRQAHPWHGLSAGSDAPNIIRAYIEIVPTDVVSTNSTKSPGT